MIGKNRNASHLNSCVSPTNFTEEYEFVNAEGVGGIKGNIYVTNAESSNHNNNFRVTRLYYGIVLQISKPIL